MTYQLRVLDDVADADLTLDVEPLTAADAEGDFTAASLFIDDCPDATTCWKFENVGPLPDGPVGTCWNPSFFKCIPCAGDWADLNTICNNTYPDCDGQCCAGATSGYPCPD